LPNIAEHANGILEERKEPVEPVGESWVPRFLDWYCDKLQNTGQGLLQQKGLVHSIRMLLNIGLDSSRRKLLTKGSKSTIFTVWMRVDFCLPTKVSSAFRA